MYVMNRIKEIYMIWSISSVGTTDINNGFLTRWKEPKKLYLFWKKKFRRNDRY